MIDLTPLLQAIIALVAAVVAYYVVPYIKDKRVITLITLAVSAAEQLYKETGMGAEKKQYVLDYLAARGIKVDDAAIAQQVDALIEGAVNQLKSG